MIRECKQIDCPNCDKIIKKCLNGNAHKKDFDLECKEKNKIIKYFKDNNINQ